jgi:galactofuranosylgalactofuranosylrhamnosyl-N-acetylglucosaminyl-diphospho-decaprenol beta-1,5/1,6-galactofuranosyltransferase
MNYIDHTLSNIVLPKGAEPLGGWDLYIKTPEGSVCAPEINGCLLQGSVDFFTYFNACSLAKWKKYAGIKRVYLHLEFANEAINKEYACTIQFFGRSYLDSAASSLASGVRLTSTMGKTKENGSLVFDLLIPETDYEVIGFALDVRGGVVLEKAHYYARVAEEQINPVKIALCTTTFLKEDYIIPNIELVKNEVLAADDVIAKNFHMFVIDNGRTLDAEALSDEGVTVLPNPNVGGSGGFARGMMEAMKHDENFTHVLLMDDDVSISTESLRRTFNLLSLATGKYKNAFINGAMLVAEEPNRQFEDVSYVVNSGAYASVKSNKYYMDQQQYIVRNEHIDVEIPKAYGAWWFSCIPVSAIEQVGLPLPLFVRCDDVEYGMRAKPIYMTMNGICVWHDGFMGRSRASVDSYQYVRNFLIMIAMTDCSSQDLFMLRMERALRLQLRVMSYDAADLILDGIADYLKGPDYFASLNGEEVIKRNAKKNEKLVPLDELAEPYRNVSYNKRLLGDQSYIKPFLKLMRTLPYDRHLLPDVLLRDTPEAVFYSGLSILSPRTIGTKTLVAIDLEGNQGAVRHMDRERYQQIMDRWKALKSELKERGDEVRAAYKEALPYLTSTEFWEKYLGLDEADVS